MMNVVSSTMTSEMPSIPTRERAEHGENADDHRPRVGADLTGLQLRPDPPERTREIRAAVDEQPVHEPHVHAAPEQTARDGDGGPDDGAIVRLVHVVLVREHPLDPLLRRRLAFRYESLRLEARHGDGEARNADRHRRPYERVLRAGRHL